MHLRRPQRLGHWTMLVIGLTALGLTGCGSDQKNAADIYEQVAESVGWVTQTDGRGLGSSVLIDDGYLVTNAHVVKEQARVDVAFHNGERHNDVRIVDVDFLHDVALIGPIETKRRPLRFQTSDTLQAGDPLFVIGYPGDLGSVDTPTRPLAVPAISAGILGRLRFDERARMTYLQVDVAAGQGQSGGAVVDADGTVVGLSTLGNYSSANYLLAADGRSIRRVALDLRQPPHQGLALLPPRFRGAGSKTGPVSSRGSWDTSQAVVWLNRGERFELQVDGPSADDATIQVFDPLGFEPDSIDYDADPDFDDARASAAARAAGREAPREVLASATFEAETSGRHLLTIRSLDPQFRLVYVASHGLTWFTDPDDGHTVSVGDRYDGVFQHPSDVDTIKLPLDKGESVDVLAAANGAVSMTIDTEAGRDEPIIIDSFIGGLYGGDARARFTAPITSTYLIAIGPYSEEFTWTVTVARRTP